MSRPTLREVVEERRRREREAVRRQSPGAWPEPTTDAEATEAWDEGERDSPVLEG